MSRVQVFLEAGREWIREVVRIPAAAFNSKHCELPSVDPFRSVSMEVGSILLESRRNNKGVLVSVVLPTGYAFPTGRSAPEHCWFPMLKTHLRGLLAMSQSGRLVTVATIGIDKINEQICSGKIIESSGRQAILRLDDIRSAAVGDLHRGSGDNDVLKSFYAWLAGTASQLAKQQREILLLVERTIRGQALPKEVNDPDIDSDLLETELQRHLDM